MNITPEMMAEDERRWGMRDVITELGYCGNYMSDRKYMRNLDIRFYAYLMRKAHELLKEQEARVMEFSEIASFDSVVYLEDIDKIDVIRAICNGYIVTCDLLSFSTKRGAPVGSVEDYNKRWRAWTSRPTEEQRKAVKWYE